MYCLTFFVRHRKRPVHLCFDGKSEATEVLSEFCTDISRASDDELVVVHDQAAFLKRSFIAVEMDGVQDDDGGDGESDEDGDVLSPPPRDKTEKKRRRIDRRNAESKLETDLEQIIASLRAGFRTGDHKPSQKIPRVV